MADGAGEVDDWTAANISCGRRLFESVWSVVEGSTTGVEGRDADTKVCLRSGWAFVTVDELALTFLGCLGAPPRLNCRVDVAAGLFMLAVVFGVTEGGELRFFCAQDAARGKGAITKYQLGK